MYVYVSVCGHRDDGSVQPTFAILPRCVPGQAEERREENNRSGHSSISEPHLISAMPLLGWVSGTPELPLPPSLRSSLCLQGVETGVGAGIRRRQKVRNRRIKEEKPRCRYPECVYADLWAGRGVLECTLSLGASFLVVGRRAELAPPVPSYSDQSRVNCLPGRDSLHGRLKLN